MTATTATMARTVQATNVTTPMTIFSRTQPATSRMTSASSLPPMFESASLMPQLSQSPSGPSWAATAPSEDLGRARGRVTVEARKRDRAQHPARPEDLEPQPSQAPYEPPRQGGDVDRERLRLAALGHAVERGHHDGNQVAGRRGHGWPDLPLPADPAQRGRLGPAGRRVRRAGAVAGAELVQDLPAVGARVRLEAAA